MALAMLHVRALMLLTLCIHGTNVRQSHALKVYGNQLPTTRCDPHAVGETKFHLDKRVVPEMELKFVTFTAIPWFLYSGGYACGPMYQIMKEASKTLRAK